MLSRVEDHDTFAQNKAGLSSAVEVNGQPLFLTLILRQTRQAAALTSGGIGPEIWLSFVRTACAVVSFFYKTFWSKIYSSEGSDDMVFALGGSPYSPF